MDPERLATSTERCVQLVRDAFETENPNALQLLSAEQKSHRYLDLLLVLREFRALAMADASLVEMGLLPESQKSDAAGFAPSVLDPHRFKMLTSSEMAVLAYHRNISGPIHEQPR